MNYDFIEIGTCFHNTIIETVDDTVFGLSIEPIKEYLDMLPDKKNVTKINVAISKDNTFSEDYIYYIPKHISEKHQLEETVGYGFFGGNKIGGLHDLHKKHGVEHLVRRVKVRCVPIGYIYTEYNVESVRYLKIDTEGFDSFIINTLMDFLDGKDISLYPQKIRFECNQTADLKNTDLAIEKLEKHYNIIEYASWHSKKRGKWQPDYVLELKPE